MTSPLYFYFIIFFWQTERFAKRKIYYDASKKWPLLETDFLPLRILANVLPSITGALSLKVRKVTISKIKIITKESILELIKLARKGSKRLRISGELNMHFQRGIINHNSLKPHVYTSRYKYWAKRFLDKMDNTKEPVLLSLSGVHLR